MPWFLFRVELRCWKDRKLLLKNCLLEEPGSLRKHILELTVFVKAQGYPTLPVSCLWIQWFCKIWRPYILFPVRRIGEESWCPGLPTSNSIFENFVCSISCKFYEHSFSFSGLFFLSIIFAFITFTVWGRWYHKAEHNFIEQFQQTHS